jgi:drug/metabolite transporter (DMT)-like permease
MSRAHVRLVLLLVPALWGLVFVGVNQLLNTLSVFEIVTLRYLLIVSAFGVTLLGFRSTRPSISRDRWGLVVFAGFMGVPASQFGLVYAQRFLAPPLAAVLITLAPAVTAILAPMLVNERVSRRQVLGFSVAFSGAVVVIVVGAGDETIFEISNIAGAAVGLVTPIGWALYTLALKRLSGDQKPFGAVGITLLVGSVFLLPLVPTSVDGATRMDPTDWAWMAYLAIGGTFAAYLIWYWSLKYLDASETAAYLYLVPAFALLWSLVILGEVPRLGAVAGGVLVLVGVALTQTAGRTLPTAGLPKT